MKKYLLSLLFIIAPFAQAETLLTQLPNGMKVLIKEDNRAPVVAIRLWYQVGSVDENVGKTGLSHALEHMMFKGTHNLPDGAYSHRISAMGGDNNAYTSRTETVYTVNIAANRLDEVLKMEADRMVNLNFSDTAFANEMDVIREERRLRTDDSPTGKMWETLNMKMWQQPFNQAPIIGYMADINTLTANDLRAWYQQWYAPNNAMLVIVGDVNAQQALKSVQQHFADIPAKPLPARHQESEMPSEAQGFNETITAITRQPILNLTWRVPAMQKINDKMPYALDMLAMVLSGTDSARYDKKLQRGEAIALGVSVGYNDYGRKNATFSIIAMPNANISPDTLKTRLLAELQDIAQNGVSQQELALIRKPIKTTAIFAKDSVYHQADILGDLEMNSFGYHTEAAQMKRTLKASPSDIQAAAQLLLDSPIHQLIVLPQ